MKRKILAALLLTMVATGVAIVIAHFSFREMMGTVEQLSEPNEKLTKLNRLFEDVTMLDQQQRAEAIQNPQKPYKYFLDQSGYLQMMIDSLRMLDWDSVQRERLTSLPAILDERNQIFVSYMKVKAELADNKEFSQQLDTLSALLRESQRSTDSIVTTQRKTITRYIQQDSLKSVAKDRNFLKKLFSKKKEKPAEKPRLKVEEELDVTVDTLTIAHKGLDLEDIQRRMRELETDQRSQRKKLLSKELELIHANSLFINQLLNTLHEVENEEVTNMRKSNVQAAQAVNHGISRMAILMLALLVATAVLTYFILIDISRSNYYRLQLEKAKNEAEELTKIKQRFLANMSHEIRTPLQSIIGFAEQLKLELGKENESAQAIHSSSEHLLQIVNEVLDYSRITSGNYKLAKENFRLLTVVKEVESAMRIQAQRRNLTFILDTEKAYDRQLFGDSFRLRQILYNLLGNAIKFTHKGFIKLAVTTADLADREKCVFEITDSGIGMSKEELQKVFHQFEQANTEITKTYGGTGLGLSIVKSLVDVQGGEMEVNSTPGVGSTFRITLTFDKTDHLNEKTEPVRKPVEPSMKPKVLLVDDDTMIVKLCSLILSKNQIPHRTFQDALKLLALPVEDDVTHILIDIRMPGVNGVDVCRSLREQYPDSTKFIALTAHVLPEERTELIGQGFDVVLAKPFYETELLKVIGGSQVEQADKSGLPDFAMLRKMTMGDESLFQTIMQQFLDESTDDIVTLEDSIDANDPKIVREIVHKLAGRSGQIGINDISVKFHQIEKGLVKGKNLEELHHELHAVISETRQLLRNIRRSDSKMYS